MSDDPLLAQLLQALQTAQSPPDNRGAPANVRAAVGAAQTPEDRLSTLRRFAPDARPHGSDNFVFTDPRTGRPTIYNPRGLDMGDVASIGPEIGEMLGGTMGGALALPPAMAAAPATGGMSLFAVPAAVGLGAAGGRQLVTATAGALGQTVDTRGPLRQVGDAALTAGANAATVPAGNALVGLGRAAMGPVNRMFGARTGPAALADFANAGVTPSAGAVTGNRSVQVLEQGLANTPGGAQPIRQMAEQQASELGDEARRVAGLYGTPVDPAAAGGTIRAGAQGAVQRFEARQGQLYDDAFNRIGPDTVAALPAVARLGQTIAADLASAPASRERVLRPVLERIEALTADEGQGLSFEALRSVRTDLGRLIGGPPNAASAPSSDTAVYLRQLYGALTDDMAAVARGAGPGAAHALSLADRYTRLNRGQNLPALERIIGSGTDEQVYRIAFPANGKPDPQTLLRLRRNLEPAEWNTLAATVLDRMGTATPGARGAGDTFSVATFLTNWNKLRANGDGARAVLFGGGDNARLIPELDRLARVADRLRDVQRMGNPSGTARNLIAGAGMLAAGQDVVEGDFKGAAMIAGLGLVAPRYAANLITSPQFVRWLAGAAPQVAANPASRGPALIRLGAVAEANPELREAIEAFRHTFSGMPLRTQQGQPTPAR